MALRLPRFLRRRIALRHCRRGEHERSAGRAHQIASGWETVCKHCGVTLRRPDRLQPWRVVE